jgi:4-diphosphocytidyl-2-C-methyl-D-erythritol kinase
VSEREGGLRLDAPAKLNLSLAVVGRREDGLHELVSTFVLLELADRLHLEPPPPGEAAGLTVIAAPEEEVPAEPLRNLAWRGLRAGLEREPVWRLTVEKRIPAAAGLGGGSSDAAAGWRLGRRRRDAPELPLESDLAELARIGADVPFFAAQVAAAEVRGIGERLTPIAARREHVLLVLPAFRLSTAAVFAELTRADWSSGPEAAGNDLLAPARRLRPELDDLFRRVVTAGGRPRLTGSGPTLFVLDEDPERIAAMAARLTAAGLRTLQTRLAGGPASIEPISDEEAATR